MSLSIKSAFAEILHKVLDVDKEEFKNVNRELTNDGNNFILKLSSLDLKSLRVTSKHTLD